MKMNTVLNKSKLFAFTMLIAGTMGLTSCDKDDKGTNPDDKADTKEMFGEYEGKMLTAIVTPISSKNTPDNRADVIATLDNDIIYIDSIPVRDIVVSIVGSDDNTDNIDKIIKAIGKVPYEIEYKAQFNAEKDLIIYKLEPKPLTFSFQLPTEGEENPTTLNVEVEMSSTENGNYTRKTTALEFKFNASKVSLVNGNDKTPITAFNASSFEFEMKKKAKK